MVYVSLANRILFWVGGSAAEQASELQAGQLQRAACSRLLGQLNPLICQWVISGTRLGKATDSTGHTEMTHTITTKLYQKDPSKQNCWCSRKRCERWGYDNERNTQRTVAATSASEVKTHLPPQEMRAWLCCVQTIAEASVRTGSFNGRRFMRVGTYCIYTRGHTQTHTRLKNTLNTPIHTEWTVVSEDN